MGRMFLALILALIVVAAAIVFIGPVRDEFEATVFDNDPLITNATAPLRKRVDDVGDKLAEVYKNQFGASEETPLEEDTQLEETPVTPTTEPTSDTPPAPASEQ